MGEPGPAEVERLRSELEAERAGAQHWRDVARRREAALAELKGRTSVRALLALERETADARGAARQVGKKLMRTFGRARLTASAVLERPDLPARRRRLDAAVRSVDGGAQDVAPPESEALRPGRSTCLLVVVAAHGESPRGAAAPPGTRTVLVRTDREAADHIADATEDLVLLASSATEPLTRSWFESLARAVHAGAGAATGVLVHPERPLAMATPHDLLVRSAGFEAVVDPAGVPHLSARNAGQSPTGRPAPSDGGARPVPVTAAPHALVMLDRAAMAAAGGYFATGDVDASVLDLCLRLRRTDREVVCVEEVLAVDHRPVSSAGGLSDPMDEGHPAWALVLDRAGPLLRRAAVAIGPDELDVAITVASPSWKVATTWGDWHLAEALARSLERSGHTVRVQPLPEAGSPRSRCADVHLVLRGLARVDRASGQTHVLWVISHPEDLDDHELDAADLVLVASQRFAEALRERTDTPVDVMLQATDHERFRPLPVDPAHAHEITVVGKSRDVLRPMVRDAVAAGLRPAVHGTGWGHLVEPELVVAGEVPNADLPRVYSSAQVVLNDHWETMRHWGFVSNRVFDVLACGTPLVSDRLPELEAMFGDLVPTWETPEELGRIVAEIQADPAAARARSARARAVVLADHTFDHRADQFLGLLRRSQPLHRAPRS